RLLRRCCADIEAPRPSCHFLTIPVDNRELLVLETWIVMLLLQSLPKRRLFRRRAQVTTSREDRGNTDSRIFGWFAVLPEHYASRRAVAREHQAGTVHNLLQIDDREKIFDEWFPKFAFGKSIRDNEAELTVRLKQAKATLEKRTNEQKFHVGYSWPS